MFGINTGRDRDGSQVSRISRGPIRVWTRVPGKLPQGLRVLKPRIGPLLTRLTWLTTTKAKAGLAAQWTRYYDKVPA
jgi:hypothetical protein